MKRYYVKERTLARGRGVSMGIDVHKESWQPGRIPSPDLLPRAAISEVGRHGSEIRTPFWVRAG
jgi:hypothetical protein